MPTTRDLMDRVACDPVLRRLCGWSRVGEIPSESTFSRAFGEFARSRLPERMHEAVVKAAFEETIVGHISRDSTAIDVREKPEPKDGKAKRPSRLQRQLRMDRDTMLDELPTAPTVGVRKNAKGFLETWRGYKLHVDAADSGVPISCLLTSASLHDSQAAIPLATLSTERVTYLYELMDAAYDSKEIGRHSYLSGYVPIIDVNTRRDKERKKPTSPTAAPAGRPTRRATPRFRHRLQIRSRPSILHLPFIAHISAIISQSGAERCLRSSTPQEHGVLPHRLEIGTASGETSATEILPYRARTESTSKRVPEKPMTPVRFFPGPFKSAEDWVARGA